MVGWRIRLQAPRLACLVWVEVAQFTCSLQPAACSDLGDVPPFRDRLSWWASFCFRLPLRLRDLHEVLVGPRLAAGGRRHDLRLLCVLL